MAEGMGTMAEMGAMAEAIGATHHPSLLRNAPHVSVFLYKCLQTNCSLKYYGFALRPAQLTKENSTSQPPATRRLVSILKKYSHSMTPSLGKSVQWMALRA